MRRKRPIQRKGNPKSSMPDSPGEVDNSLMERNDACEGGNRTNGDGRDPIVVEIENVDVNMRRMDAKRGK